MSRGAAAGGGELDSRAIERTSGSRWRGFYSPRRGRVGTALQARAPPLSVWEHQPGRKRALRQRFPLPPPCARPGAAPPSPPLPRAQPVARSHALPTVCRGHCPARLPARVYRRSCLPADSAHFPPLKAEGGKKALLFPSPSLPLTPSTPLIPYSRIPHPSGLLSHRAALGLRSLCVSWGDNTTGRALANWLRERPALGGLEGRSGVTSGSFGTEEG